ncbi:MAG TPA: hypothetical protein VE575_05825 [Acidimicrobiales bacterium]|nr:hypothetical protein [Acidimicrobiales bacterium]
MAFGYHPYFRLPGASRDDVRPCLPARRHLELDDRQLPTGAARVESAEDEPIGQRTFDDLYELDSDRELALTAGGRRLVLRLDDGYRYAQVFGPRGAEFACLEPMTAPVNALNDRGYSLVAPGGSYTARFTILVEDVS